MLMLRIAGLIVSIPLGIYIGCRMVGICLAWVKEGLDSLIPQNQKDKKKDEEKDIWD